MNEKKAPCVHGSPCRERDCIEYGRTDPTTPATQAGRALLDKQWPVYKRVNDNRDEGRKAILAIEAEAAATAVALVLAEATRRANIAGNVSIKTLRALHDEGGLPAVRRAYRRAERNADASLATPPESE